MIFAMFAMATLGGAWIGFALGCWWHRNHSVIALERIEALKENRRLHEQIEDTCDLKAQLRDARTETKLHLSRLRNHRNANNALVDKIQTQRDRERCANERIKELENQTCRDRKQLKRFQQSINDYLKAHP